MAIETTKTLICDRCGVRETPIFDRTSEMTIRWDGHKGGRTAQGDFGGYTIKGSAQLCEPCTDEFIAWVKKP